MAERRNVGLRTGAELQVKEISSLQVKPPGFQKRGGLEAGGRMASGRRSARGRRVAGTAEQTYSPFLQKHSESQDQQ